MFTDAKKTAASPLDSLVARSWRVWRNAWAGLTVCRLVAFGKSTG
jgi:hypothetical protein